MSTPSRLSGCTGVVWNTRKKAWIACWYDDHRKARTRCFASRKYGDQRALELAIAFRTSNSKPPPQRTIPGVSRVGNSWSANIERNGKEHKKRFSYQKYGARANEAAIAWRQSMETLFDKHVKEFPVATPVATTVHNSSRPTKQPTLFVFNISDCTNKFYLSAK